MNIIVGIAEMKVSKEQESILAAYSLGSCIGVVVYDKVARVGGLLNFMLPDSSLDPEKAHKNPCMFADTGIPHLFRTAYTLGAKKQRMKVVAAGGSQVLGQNGFFNIGRQNDMALRKIFQRNNVIIDHIEVGGTCARTFRLSVKTGDVFIKTFEKGEKKI